MNQKATCPQCATVFEVPSEDFNTIISCPTCGAGFNPMKELTRAAWESTKTPEFQASFKAHIAERNKNISHEEFVAGVGNGTMGFKCFFGEPFQLLTIPQKKIFAIFVILYKFAPFILVPIWAYHERNWWILFGIPASQFGIFLAARAAVQGAKSSSGGFLSFLFIGLWLATGFRSIETFYSLCALWSWALFLIADSYQDDCARQNLVASSTVVDDAVANQKIMIVRRDDEAVA
jgi:hypothetical protein